MNSIGIIIILMIAFAIEMFVAWILLRQYRKFWRELKENDCL